MGKEEVRSRDWREEGGYCGKGAEGGKADIISCWPSSQLRANVIMASEQGATRLSSY